MHGNGVVGPYPLKHQSEESIFIKCWTFSSGQKLENSQIILLFTKMMLFLQLYEPSILFQSKCNQTNGSEDTVKHVDQHDHPPKFSGLFHIGIREESIVSDFCAQNVATWTNNNERNQKCLAEKS